MVIAVLFLTTNKIRKGRTAKVIRVSGILMVHRMMKEPTTLTSEMNRSSGPWWANSEMSIKSLTMRDMMVPVLFSSKKEKGSVSTWRKSLRRISAWMRTPRTCPQ